MHSKNDANARTTGHRGYHVSILLTSQVSILELPTLVSSAAGTTSLILIRAPAQLKQPTSLPTAEVGPVMG